MYLIGMLEVLRHESVRRRAVPWHHPNDSVAARMESEVQFLARYALDRPHDQCFWWANFSAFLNRMVDAIQAGLHRYGLFSLEQQLIPDGDDDYSRSRSKRLVMLTRLCRYWLNRPNQWFLGCKHENVTIEKFMFGDRLTFLLEKLYPKDHTIVLFEPFDGVLLHSWALLSPPGGEGLSSTVVNRFSFR